MQTKENNEESFTFQSPQIERYFRDRIRKFGAITINPPYLKKQFKTFNVRIPSNFPVKIMSKTAMGPYKFNELQYFGSVDLFERPFREDWRLTETTISCSSMKKIPASCFLNSGLRKIRFSDKDNSILEEIGDGAFYDCSKLKEIFIPPTVENIGKCAFSGCSRLKTVKLPDHLHEIGNSAFDNCRKLKKMKLPDNLKIIGYNAFEKCFSLENMIIPESVEDMGAEAFLECTGLKSVTIAKGTNLKEIPGSTFEGCTSLDNVVIPIEVKKINPFAFRGCTSLRCVSTFAEYIDYFSFAECTNLKIMFLNSTNPCRISPCAFANINKWRPTSSTGHIEIYVHRCTLDFYKNDFEWNRIVDKVHVFEDVNGVANG